MENNINYNINIDELVSQINFNLTNALKQSLEPFVNAMKYHKSRYDIIVNVMRSMPEFQELTNEVNRLNSLVSEINKNAIYEPGIKLEVNEPIQQTSITKLNEIYNNINVSLPENVVVVSDSTLNDEKTYYDIRDKMEIHCPLDNAKRFYYQRKTCFRGMLRYNKNGKFNIPYGKYKTINFSDLTNSQYEELLSRTEILNKDYEYIFQNYNDENNFMFLDPPYDSEFTDYGYCQFGKDQQIKLAQLFKATKIKCLMVIGKTKFIEDLYSEYIVDEYDKKYKFKLYDNRVGSEINTKHLVIKNY